ncbi:MAG: helix-turn-helix domain-containing protein [Oscillospiraceae bacterium]|nr:helix-turn-helix domain-containing protein [Oscillospiraceae bacterium]
MNKEIDKRIGNNVRRLRKQKKMTQDQLAAKLQVNGCDITRSSVAKIEVGQRHLYPDEIILIKEILGAEYKDILDVKKE